MYEAVRAVNPRLVYVSISGYGMRGPDASKTGFDAAAFWARSGLMAGMGEPAAPPPLPRRGQGDHTTALNALAATLAGLRLRDRTGEGQHVEVTLQATGAWTNGAEIQSALVSRMNPGRHTRTRPRNPLWNSYPLAGGRWLMLVMPQPDPVYWPRFCAAMGHPEWLADPRYDGVHNRRANSGALTAELDAIFAAHDLAYWTRTLDEHGLIWATVDQLTDVTADPQMREMDWFATIEDERWGPFEVLDTPFKIYGADVGVRGPAPAPGEHTYDVLAELGVSAEDVDRYATDGALG
jgi:crotonobetainyl-CoA:carnitine CoA-transferase CaiB-like acyl-CoA transferase